MLLDASKFPVIYFNLLTKMIWLTPLIILQSAIAIAAPQEDTAQFKFFKDRGISRQRLDDGSPTEAKVHPKEVKLHSNY